MLTNLSGTVLRQTVLKKFFTKKCSTTTSSSIIHYPPSPTHFPTQAKNTTPSTIAIILICFTKHICNSFYWPMAVKNLQSVIEYSYANYSIPNKIILKLRPEIKRLSLFEEIISEDSEKDQVKIWIVNGPFGKSERSTGLLDLNPFFLPIFK